MIKFDHIFYVITMMQQFNNLVMQSGNTYAVNMRNSGGSICWMYAMLKRAHA